MEMEWRYFNWVVEKGPCGEFFATRTMPDGEEISVRLARWEGEDLIIGWWPAEPKLARGPTLIMGICLFDGRWVLEFEPQGKGNPGAKRQLALPSQREDALKRISRGQKPVRLYVPKGLGRYHKLLLAFQELAVNLLQPKPVKIIYHLPLEEYKAYIENLGLGLGNQLDHQLQDLAKEIEERVREWSRKAGVGVEFVTGLNPDNPEESFLHPYLERMGEVGVEDLVELRLSYEAWRRTGVQIPVLCAVLGVPHPYLESSGEREVIEL